MDVRRHSHQHHKEEQLVEDRMGNGLEMDHLQMDGIAVLVGQEDHQEVVVTTAAFHKVDTIIEDLHHHEEGTDDNLGDQQMEIPAIQDHLEELIISRSHPKEYDMPSHHDQMLPYLHSLHHGIETASLATVVEIAIEIEATTIVDP
jgi:hypothetical protein